MAKTKEFSFIGPTLKFSIAGLFIPGFTAIVILGIQMGIAFLGVECSNSWKVLWTLTSIATIVSPVIFIRLMNVRAANGYNLTSKEILIFNIAEYTFIQCTLAPFFTTGKTLCYVTDGQNGLEFAFTGWMAIPCLVIFSLVFDFVRKRNRDQ